MVKKSSNIFDKKADEFWVQFWADLTGFFPDFEEDSQAATQIGAPPSYVSELINAVWDLRYKCNLTFCQIKPVTKGILKMFEAHFNAATHCPTTVLPAPDDFLDRCGRQEDGEIDEGNGDDEDDAACVSK